MVCQRRMVFEIRLFCQTLRRTEEVEILFDWVFDWIFGMVCRLDSLDKYVSKEQSKLGSDWRHDIIFNSSWRTMNIVVPTISISLNIRNLIICR